LFSIRHIAANGYVWTGAGTHAHTHTQFPPLGSLASADYPTENMCSIALRVGYSQFAYFTGGDLTSYSWDGDAPQHAAVPGRA
jgi:hypothetical protein